MAPGLWSRLYPLVTAWVSAGVAHLFGGHEQKNSVSLQWRARAERAGNYSKALILVAMKPMILHRGATMSWAPCKAPQSVA